MCSARKVKTVILTDGTFTNMGSRKKMTADTHAESKAIQAITKVLRIIGIISL